MERMSPLDATFLHVEDGISHMHIASCAIMEGPPPPYEHIVELFRSKLALVPRYRQRVRFVPGGLGRPVWVDDPHFRLDYHVRHTALPPPGRAEDLRNLMGRLMSQQLDRHRPLWETWVVEGLEDGTWALISKVHHCMVDGISGTDLMAVVLDQQRTPDPPAADHWEPRPEPSDAELVRHALAETLASPTELGRWVRSATRQPRRLAAEAAVLLQGARSMGGRLRPNVELSIEGPIGPHRRWAWARTTLDEIKVVRSALGGTVNDVVLAAITRGFRDLLMSRGDPVDGVVVRSLVPVSVRAREDHTLNNQVSAMIAELPVGIADPVERLESIQAQMQSLKESHMADAFKSLTDLGELTPPMFLGLGLRAATALLRRLPQRSVNTVTTNVPGPQVPLYACGREMLHYYPFVPISHGVRTGVAILSYNRKITFGITGDWDTVPDVEVLAEGIEAGLAELLACAAAAPSPGSRQRSARTASAPRTRTG
jgi:WS/DGAT/MGAT family acyltransferase